LLDRSPYKCGAGVQALGIITLLISFARLRALFAAGGLALGLALGAASQIGIVSLYSQTEGRDFGLRVALGETVSLESLKPLLRPGEPSFSRIISATSKYGFDPAASTPGSEIPRLSDAKRWLLIQPDPGQLPRSREVLAHLRAGGDVTILFAPEQGRNSSILGWLRTLGFYIQETSGLALAEDDRPGDDGLLGRRSVSILREIRPSTRALPTSLFKDRDADQFFQVYTVRPTGFPRTSGLLNIGFSADQFSDGAVGDIWEGIEPTSIGKLRERQIAAMLQGKEIPSPFPEDLTVLRPGMPSLELPAYLLVEDGKTILIGRFDAASTPTSALTNPSPIENPVGYLLDLKTTAIAFVESSCPKQGRITKCDKRMLGGGMLEWMVSWTSHENGSRTAVELVHERNFSGLGKTLNVVFGE
jgi:hypothetical protein